MLIKEGYVENPMDPCVWNETINGNQITIIIYVDDLAISCRDLSEVHKARDLKEFVDIKVKESIDMTCLGMSFNITDKGIEVEMIIYIKDILQEWDGLYEYAHPTDDSLFTLDDKKFFHRVFAKLRYLCKRARPDIALPVHYLCTRVQNPTKHDGLTLNRMRSKIFD